MKEHSEFAKYESDNIARSNRRFVHAICASGLTCKLTRWPVGMVGTCACSWVHAYFPRKGAYWPRGTRTYKPKPALPIILGLTRTNRQKPVAPFFVVIRVHERMHCENKQYLRSTNQRFHNEPSEIFSAS